MRKLFSFVTRRLWIKVLIPIALSVLLVMGISLWMSIKAQNKLGRDQLTSQNNTLAQAIEGGMFEALAIGDNDTVRVQFKHLNEKVKGLKVFVYDFNGVVSFSTDASAPGNQIDGYVTSEGLGEIHRIMDQGKASDEAVIMEIGEKMFISKSAPIFNEQRCFHCHGNRRKVLGGISVLSSMTEMNTAIQQTRNKSIAITGAGLALIVVLVWIIFYFLVNTKVRMVLDVASKLRQKDFTQSYEAKNGDEINHILNRINLVTRELRSTIQEIIQGAADLDESSRKMNGIAASQDQSSSRTSQMASSVSAAAEEMSANNEAIAKAMDAAAESLNAVAAAVDEMTTTVGEISRNAAESKTVTDTVVANFEDILTAVEQLGVRADDVDEVTYEIRSISEQVSLLALNAKIEAARAGEAGKGFAVVAQEITELAADTSRSTQEADEKLARIKVTVAELIDQVSGLSGSVKNSEQSISGIAASVEEQSATTLEISKNINDVSNKISNVNDSVIQGAKVASEIARDIAAVEEMSSQVQDESHGLSRDAESLSQMAKTFTQLMKQFKI